MNEFVNLLDNKPRRHVYVIKPGCASTLPDVPTNGNR